MDLPWAKFITLFEFRNILSEYFLTFLASKNDLGGFYNFVVLSFKVALNAIEP